MATSHDELIHTFKMYINRKDTDGFKEFLFDVQDTFESLPTDYIFQKVYVHACLKKNQPIVDILMDIYKELDPITQISLRQTFAYGKYLLKR
jgi:hypothetical protein